MHPDLCSPSHEAGPRPRRSALAALLAPAILATCCSCASRPAQVDAPRAREALKATLDGWKAGEAHPGFAKARPAMTVQDLDWMGGSRLVEFRVEGDGQEAGANLRVPVELTIRDKGGKQVKKKVKYTIGTSPTITVFREIF